DEQVVNDGSSPTAERTDLRGGTAETKWQVDVPARISLTGFPILAGPKQHTQLAMTGSRTGVPLQTADREMTGESVTVPKVPSNDEQVVNDGSSPTAKRKDLRGGTAETKWQVDVPARISLTGFPILAESKRHTQLAMTGPRSSAPLHTADQAKMEMPFSSSENPCQSHPFKNYGKFRVNI
ncbi:hypothetical protein, partial [Herbaspirillum sp. Sphag1AN]|uniref:hypothetical protein n=1 Tax=Herbaspirillum sp. Sphag1AN TaxID=2587030 RepID=UPI001C84A34A